MVENDKNKIRLEFAERFCKALKELGYSTNQQKEHQRLFSVSGQAVRKWISGQSLPTSARMPQVADVLGVRRAWLQDGEKPMRPILGKVSEKNSSYVVKEGLSTEEMKLVLKYRALSIKKKKVIKDTLLALLE